MKRCLLFAGGPLSDCDSLPKEELVSDYVIACDAGYRAAVHYGFTPDLALGDFDSYTGGIAPGVEVLTVPAEKDDTDTMLGLKTGIARGYRDFLIVGGFGGRLDHTIANVQALHWLCGSGARGEIRANDNRAWAVREGTLTLPRMEGWYLSVFALGGACAGVTLEGLAYPLEDRVLVPSNPLGVSNEFIEAQAKITVKHGTLLVVASHEG